MTIDYIVSSLPPLAFDAPAPMTPATFEELAGDSIRAGLSAWADIEAQLRNALVEGRGGADRFKRPATGCSVYWRNRVLECFAEKDVARRDELLDRVWWDAAGELTKPADPLGAGALATYAVRLRIAAKRTEISKDAGNAAFDRLTATTKEAI
ncbi:MAG: hypothetical protein II823_00915 [Kiritimatiellae bacterium]|nr:hypothetical protein [Kiritimatiellia bacterium]